jgi:hypothetical protein
MLWIIMADVVAALHTAYIVFVVAGFAAILAGSAARWHWVRNGYFRIMHLAMILLVCSEVIFGITCPLTGLENALRLKGGQTGYARDFIGYRLTGLSSMTPRPGCSQQPISRSARWSS